MIDTTGAAHLHGGEDAMLKGMVERLAASGFAARAAIADSWGAAHALARTSARPTLVVPAGESAKTILDLPGPLVRRCLRPARDRKAQVGRGGRGRSPAVDSAAAGRVQHGGTPATSSAPCAGSCAGWPSKTTARTR